MGKEEETNRNESRKVKKSRDKLGRWKGGQIDDEKRDLCGS